MSLARRHVLRGLAGAVVWLFASAALAAPTFQIVPYEVPAQAERCEAITFTDDGTVTGRCVFPGFRSEYMRWRTDGRAVKLPFQDPVVDKRNNKNQVVMIDSRGSPLFAGPGMPPIDFLAGASSTTK